jgi:hypothetical protein
MKDLATTLRTIYMYLVALISVVVFIIGAVNLIDTTLKTWVFPTDNWEWEDPVWQCNNSALLVEEVIADGKVVSSGSQWETMEECIDYYDERNVKNRANQRNRDFAFGVSMTVVSLPIWLLHMWFIKQDKKKKK